MKSAIDAVKAQLEATQQALGGAEESYAKAQREADAARNRSERAYEARAKIARDVDRLTKALELLEEGDNQ